ncbi:MAG TPA: BadF/BadG/BcrA/BcrD ATPase family protein, partial [Holophaga sp.]|nr:BadF/BadG/BcrA/BcrD ATPase family protein [Holophaga sp.]
RDLLAAWDWGGVATAAATGRLARQVALTRVPSRQALATGFAFQAPGRSATLVSIGSRGFSVLEMRENGTEVHRENGRCAQGTGNFLQQLVGRFGLEVATAAERAAGVEEGAHLSGRCPVILKTDMTHLANKGEDRDRILAGLLDAMCENVQAILRPANGPPTLALCGGVARSRRVREHFRAYAARRGLAWMDLPGEEGLYLEAAGAALLGSRLALDPPALADLLEAPAPARVDLLPPLAAALPRVRRMPPLPPAAPAGTRDVLLGFDIGSTGSKAVAVDLGTGERLWDGYLGTDGAPVRAAQALMAAWLESPAGEHRLRAFGVTGSGREIVGSLLATCYGRDPVWVMNEIAAHAAGAVAQDPRVDTIFEIGGQDAKYIRLEGGRVVDAAMNESCSAGTGSFIEEQGRRLEGVRDVRHLGELALGADATASLGQHCSIFMAEVMDEAVAAGVGRDRIIAGIYHSVVANYLNRVKGSRSCGSVVFCQGMPFASAALAAAVAAQTGSEVVVPPDPGLMGALGIALLARRNLPVPPGASLDGRRFLEAKVVEVTQFQCGSTQGCGRPGNRCRVDRLATEVGGERRTFAWGGGCSLWDKGAARTKLPDRSPDPFRERRELAGALVAALPPAPDGPRVAMAEAFQLQGLLPFFAALLRGLGAQPLVVPVEGRADLARGLEEAAVPFCAPMQQYHGLVSRMAGLGADHLFLPLVRELPRVDGEAHSAACPITQGAPDVLKHALAGTPSILSPVVDGGPGTLDGPALRESCLRLARTLGREEALDAALAAARELQLRYERGLAEIGARALAFARARDLVPVVVLGRAYTLHDDVLNSNVPAILRTQGALAIPCDCLPLPGDTPTFREVYWGHSQRILRAAWRVATEPGLYGIFCSNYSCGPDSFTGHTLAWMMEGKPFAVIETDGHAGDAGTRTRVEAFLHCVAEDRARGAAPRAVDPTALEVGTSPLAGVARGGETLLVPAMGPESLVVAAALRGTGVRAEALPPADAAALRAGRRHTSGKECLPMTLTLGSLLNRLEGASSGERFLFLMPSGCGPCRLGSYAGLDKLILDRLGEGRRVELWAPPWGDYFLGFDAGFPAVLLAGIAAAGVLEEALAWVRPAEREPGLAQAIRDRAYKTLVAEVEGAVRERPGAARALAEALSGRAFGFPALVRGFLEEMRAADTGARLPTVLVTGEIYVRLEPFANGGLNRALAERGVRVLMEPSTEAMRYSSLSALETGQKRGPGAHLSAWVQERILQGVQRESHRVLGLPGRPAIREILATAAPYLRPALEGEAVLTIGGPLHLWRRGAIDAAVAVGPLECMPNKLAEAQLLHVTEREGLPALALSLGGDPVDPDVLDNFLFQVKARHAGLAGSPLGVMLEAQVRP